MLADASVELAINQTREVQQSIWDSLSGGKKAVLAALADGLRPTGSRATERAGITRAALQSALRELAREGQQISRHYNSRASGDWRFTDPLFARWVRSRGRGS